MAEGHDPSKSRPRSAGSRFTPAASVRKFTFRMLNLLSRLTVRVSELIPATFMLAVISMPLLTLLTIRRFLTGKPVFDRRYVYGRAGRTMTINYFNCRHLLARNAFLFFYVLNGDLRLLGPTIKDYEPWNPMAGDVYRDGCKPGIFDLRHRLISVYEGRENIEPDYRFRQTMKSDLLLLLKLFFTVLFPNKINTKRRKVELLGVRLRNMTTAEAVAAMVNDLKRQLRRKIRLVNSAGLNRLISNRKYAMTLRRVDYLLPEGFGLRLGCRLNGTPLKETMCGTTMLPSICRAALKNNFTIYLLNNATGTADTAGDGLRKQFPGLRIVGTGSGTQEESVAVINAAAPDLLLIDLCTQEQERWLDSNFNRLNCGIAVEADFGFNPRRQTPLHHVVAALKFAFLVIRQKWNRDRKQWKRRN